MNEWWDIYWGCIPMSPFTRKKKNLARGYNWQEFMNQFQAGFSACMSLFEWEGLPDTCDPLMLERCFLLSGHAAMFKKDGVYLTLASDVGYNRNPYGYPTKGRLYGFNGTNYEADFYVPYSSNKAILLTGTDGGEQTVEPNAVLGWDNVNGYPMINYVSAAARRIADVIRSCDVAVKTMKSPFIIVCEQQELKSISTMLDKIDENVYVILATQGFSPESLKVLTTNVNPAILDAMWQYKVNTENDLYYTLGLPNNPNEDKKERLLAGEMDTNNSATSLNILKRLDYRKKFCDQCNELWGLNIRVNVRKEVMQYVDNNTPGSTEADSNRNAMRGGSNSGGSSGQNR